MLEVYNKSAYRKTEGQPTLKHARFTSPHLIDRWDCISINQEIVPLKLFDHIEKQVLKRNEQEGIAASEFELLTATAFEIFTHQKVDVGVIEVGMGGRLDATNIIGQPTDPALSGDVDPAVFRPPPLVTAISKIGLDHQGFLGDTLKDIAQEKAGIIKPNVPVVWDTSNLGEAVEVLETKAGASRVVQLTSSELPWLTNPTLPELFVVPADEQPYAYGPDVDAVIALPDHQRQNLGVAFRSAWTALHGLDRLPALPEIPHEDREAVHVLAKAMILESARNTRFPGRLQYIEIGTLIGRQHEILLDGAHNAQSAEVLAGEVDAWRKRSEKPITFLVAASDTKNVSEILAPLLRAGDSVFAVGFGPVDGMPWVRAMGAEKLVQGAREVVPDIDAHVCGSDMLSALQAASERAAGGPMVVAGSLYLVSDVLRLLRDSGSVTVG